MHFQSFSPFGCLNVLSFVLILSSFTRYVCVRISSYLSGLGPCKSVGQCLSSEKSQLFSPYLLVFLCSLSFLLGCQLHVFINLLTISFHFPVRVSSFCFLGFILSLFFEAIFQFVGILQLYLIYC